jgi:UDP-GlcNAc:undecaprenyl-phosphate GlcNAc-1-phosphate transferase
MEADRGHLHHRLMNLGYGQRRATLMLYGVSAIVGVAAVMFSRGLNVEGIGLVAVAVMQIYIFLTDPNHVLPQIKQEKAEAAMAQLHAKKAAARAEAAAEAGESEPKDDDHAEAKASMLAAYRSHRMMEETRKSLDEWR